MAEEKEQKESKFIKIVKTTGRWCSMILSIVAVGVLLSLPLKIYFKNYIEDCVKEILKEMSLNSATDKKTNTEQNGAIIPKVDGVETEDTSFGWKDERGLFIKNKENYY